MRCPSGKHRYRNAADTMRGCRDGHRRPYRCRTCAAWHLGRATPRTTTPQAGH